jgi:DNA polymerase family B/LAGLIDADG-like domain
LFRTTPRIRKETSANMYVVQINNLALVKFVEQVLDLPGNCEKGKLKVPEIVFNSDKIVGQGFLEGMLAGDGGMNKTRNFANISTASRDFANQLGFLAAMQDFGFTLVVHKGKRLNFLYDVHFVGPETLKRICEWRFLKKAHFDILKPKLKGLCKLNCAHPLYQLFPTEESNLVLLARMARTVKTPAIDRRDATCPHRITETIDRISVSGKLHDEESVVSFKNAKRMFQGDLGFARIRKIEELDRTDEHVYCFQLADGELSGFFTGEGAVLTHNCFGYLSFRHAKFMKIDAHIAVCSIARETLLDAMHTAENRSFRVIHGIVDSLWVWKDRAKPEDYEALRSEIENTTNYKLLIEGIYKWIVFLPSKVDAQNQVANRYFGCFEKDNEIKVRGIESRRHDTPVYFKKCQEQILKELAKCDTVEELRKRARQECVSIFNEFAKRIEQRDVAPLELLITRRLSKNLGEYYSKRQLSVNAALKLEEGNLRLKAGQLVSYVITKYKTIGINRAMPEQLAENAEYDSKRYVELLADCCSTILYPFGVTKEMLLSQAQSLLNWI